MIAHLAQDIVIGAGCTIAVLTVVVCFASCVLAGRTDDAMALAHERLRALPDDHPQKRAAGFPKVAGRLGRGTRMPPRPARPKNNQGPEAA